MQSRVYVMVRCLSVYVSHRSTAATVAGRFAAEYSFGWEEISIDSNRHTAGAMQQALALSMKCSVMLTDNGGS